MDALNPRQVGLIFILALLLHACKENSKPLTEPEDPKISQEEFRDVLDFKFTPLNAEDRPPALFSDMGAWHGYGLPQDPALWGGFSGPFLLSRDNGIWLSQCYSQLQFSINGNYLDLAQASSAQLYSLPGKLIQEFQFPQLEIRFDLLFNSSRTALCQVNVTNTSSETIHLNWSWKGKSWLANSTSMVKGESLITNFEDGDDLVQLTFPHGTEIDLSDEKAYRAVLKAVDLAPERSHRSCLLQTVLLNPKESEVENSFNATALTNPTPDIDHNHKRWRTYQENILESGRPIRDSTHRMMAMKALVTMVSNWRSAGGSLHHAGLFPSVTRKWFHGFWAWDSWKHAAALALFAPDLAEDQIRAMFDYQNEEGMIPDCIFRDTAVEGHNWRKHQTSSGGLGSLESL